ncbi:MAG: hypothetical protein HYX34_07590 [Actinobacteria bacterium]|nr:hypothetical protein [Actinomycetota bacterium]
MSAPPAAAEAAPAPVTAAPPDRRDDVLFAVAVLVALAPIAVALWRAATQGWAPIGDNGYFVIRARDVGTANNPLLGTWTSASIGSGSNFNNPGPLLFDLFALPVRIFGSRMGVAVGAAALNGAAVVGTGLAARRRAGSVVGIGAVLAATGLAWTMGSALLVDPWQPHSLLLVFLLGLVLVWAVACGDAWALPWAVAVASVVLETHLSYLVLVAALGAWAVLGFTSALRAQRRLAPDGWPEHRRGAVRGVAVAAGVAAVAWAQPLYEQVTAEGGGNLSRLASHATGSGRVIGLRLGARVVADVLAVPPFWLRTSFAQALRPAPAVPAGRSQYPTLSPSAPAALALLAALALVLALAAWQARRRNQAEVARALVTALVAVGAGLVTAWRLPKGLLGLPVHQFRWLWPIAAFTTFSLGLAVATAARRPRSAPGRRWAGRRLAAVVLTVATAVVAALAVPAWNAHVGPSQDSWAMPVVLRLQERMGVLRDDGPLLLDIRGLRFGEPFSGPVMAELQRRGIPFVVDDEGMVRQVGERRRAKGGETRLLIREGDAALSTPAGLARHVLVQGLSDRERREMDRLRLLVAQHLRAVGRVPLNARGRQVVAARSQATLRRIIGRDDVGALLAYRGLSLLVSNDLLVLDPAWQRRFDRYVELQTRWDRATVGLFLAPPRAQGGP